MDQADLSDEYFGPKATTWLCARRSPVCAIQQSNDSVSRVADQRSRCHRVRRRHASDPVIRRSPGSGPRALRRKLVLRRQP
jgi:hypothetical protein